MICYAVLNDVRCVAASFVPGGVRGGMSTLFKLGGGGGGIPAAKMFVAQ